MIVSGAAPEIGICSTLLVIELSLFALSEMRQPLSSCDRRAVLDALLPIRGGIEGKLISPVSNLSMIVSMAVFLNFVSVPVVVAARQAGPFSFSLPAGHADGRPIRSGFRRPDA